MLKIGRRDHHRIDILDIIKFVIVDTGLDTMTEFLSQKILAILPSLFPDIGNGDDIEIHLVL